MIDITWSLDNPELILGWVRAQPVEVAPSDAVLQSAMDEAVQRAKNGPWPEEKVRAAIRDLLRRGGFKPTGRSKPASEYLAKSAAGDAFPRINNLVDVNNLVSLRTGWPCSILDLDLACASGGETIELRLGRKDERYVFNPAGQSIDVAGLICLARPGKEAIANAVKDSMSTKTHAATRRVLLVTYASRRIASEEEVASRMREAGALLRDHAGATTVDAGVVADPLSGA